MQQSGSGFIQYPPIEVNAVQIQGIPVAPPPPTDGDIMVYDGGTGIWDYTNYQSGLTYRGGWDANTNTPNIITIGKSANDYWIVTVAGSTDLGGGPGTDSWAIGDWAVWNGTQFDKVDNSANVTSVNTQTGAVVLDTDDISEGATNKYYSDALVALAPAVVANTAKVSADGSVTTHSDVTSAGSGQIITTGERNKLIGIEAGAQVNTVDSVNTKTGAVVLNAADVGADAAGTAAAAISTHESTYDHTKIAHTNRAVLDGISGVGSGSIITVAERSKLTNIEAGAEVNKAYPVISVNTTTPPGGTPSAGNRYIVGPGATGAWLGHDNELAIADGAGGWTFRIEPNGVRVYSTSQARFYFYDNVTGTWILEDSIIQHNSLNTSTGIQGGSATERYHLALTEYTTLRGGSADASSLHNHASLYAPIGHVGAGGAAHALVTITVAGFMSAADKVKLNGITAGAEPNAVDSVNTQTGAVVLDYTDVGADPAGAGAAAVATHESTYDHTLLHDPVTLGTANGLGLSGVGGQVLSLALATPSTAGAMSATDKTNLNTLTGGGETSLHEHPTSAINMPVIGTPTYDTLKDLIDTLQSAAAISGGVISDAGSGQINVTAGTGVIKTTDSDVGENRFFDWSAATGVALTDNSINWVYVDYNAGSPQIAVTASFSGLNLHTHVVLGRVYREGTALHFVNVGMYFADYMRKDCLKSFEVNGVQRASGIIVSETGTRNIAITAGVLWCGPNRLTFPAFDSSGADTFDYWYRNSPSGWLKQTAQSQISNTQYDDGSGTLQNLTVNRYGVAWVYAALDGHVDVLYGQGNYATLAAAENATPPSSVPGIVENFGILAAKIIIQQGASVFTVLESAFDTEFGGTQIPDHNQLGGLQGGSATERYHLTLAQLNGLSALGDIHTASDETESSTTATSAQNKLTTPFTPAYTGNYKVEWSFEVACSDKDKPTASTVTFNDGGGGGDVEVEKAVSNVSQDNQKYVNGGWFPISGFKVVALTASQATSTKVNWWQTSDKTSYIRRVRVVITKL